MNRSFLEREFFPFVIKPGRYAGHEPGAAAVDCAQSPRIVLALPRLYDRAVLIDRWQALYFTLARVDGITIERVYLPDYDALALMQERNIPLCSLESALPVIGADIVLMPLASPLDGIAAVRLVSLIAQSPEQKTENLRGPLLIAIPEFHFNCSPLSGRFDGFLFGHPVSACLQLVELYRSHAEREKRGLLYSLAKSLPCFSVTYPPQKRVEPATPPRTVGEMLSLGMIVPLIDVTHARVEIDLTNLPKELEQVSEATESLLTCIEGRLQSSGYDELYLTGFSRLEGKLGEFLGRLARRIEGKRVHLSLDRLPPRLISRELIDTLRRLGADIPVIPLGGASARLRALAHVPLAQDEIIDIATHVFAAGHEECTFEIPVGLPTEVDTDLDELAGLCGELQKVTSGFGKRRMFVQIASFVAMPQTHFQWDGMPGVGELERTFEYLRRRIKGANLRLKFPDAQRSVRDNILLRADERAFFFYERMGLRSTVRTPNENGEGGESDADTNADAILKELISQCGAFLSPVPFARPLPWSLIVGDTSDESLAEMRKQSASLNAIREQSRRSTATPVSVAPEQSLSFGRAPKRVLVRNQSAPTKNQVRIRWGKDRSLRYMSHLENIRLIERMLRRAGLPVAHTNAARPTMKLSHGHPLPLGFTSEAELIEITLDQNWQSNMIESIRAVQPQGFLLFDARIVYGRTESFASRINRAIYRLPIVEVDAETNLENRVGELLAQKECLIERTGKSTTTTVDIRAAIRDLVVTDNDLVMTLGLGERGYARPTEVLTLLLPEKTDLALRARFHRADLYCETSMGERIAGMDV